MSDERLADEQVSSQSPMESVGSAPLEAKAEESAGEKLDALDDVDFLLEEIENKIAPLALA